MNVTYSDISAANITSQWNALNNTKGFLNLPEMMN